MKKSKNLYSVSRPSSMVCFYVDGKSYQFGKDEISDEFMKKHECQLSCGGYSHVTKEMSLRDLIIYLIKHYDKIENNANVENELFKKFCNTSIGKKHFQ